MLHVGSFDKMAQKGQTFAKNNTCTQRTNLKLACRLIITHHLWQSMSQVALSYTSIMQVTNLSEK